MIRQPSSVIVAGPSGSGKSELLEYLFKGKKSSKKDCVLL